VANIREVFVLEDKATEPLTKYIRTAQQASGATNAAKVATQDLEKVQKSASASTDTLAAKVKNLVGAYAGMKTITGLVNLSDTMTQNTARLNMMNDGLQTTAELNQMIYESAQRSRGAYQETADMVAKLGTLAGDAFNSSAEIVAFAEQINKQMTLSGASTVGAQAAMLQLTQAMSSGVLRGEELNSILEQTPTIAQSIADYMGVTTGEMREMASEGAISAEVVKNAVFAAAEETNAKFAQMPMTWAQVWTSFKNTATMALQPVLTGINFLANNIDIIVPAVFGLAGAFAVFAIAANWTNIASAAMGAYTVVVNILNLAYGMLTGNMTLANAAATSLNATMLANPIFWVVAGIFLLIGALYAGVAAYNQFTGASISATGIVAGAFSVLGAMIWNQFIVPTQNGFAAFANFIGNVFNDPVTAVQVLFYDMAITVLGYIRSVAGGIEDLINAIPGVEVSLTSGIDSLYNTLQTNRQAAIDAGSYKEYVKAWEYKDLGDAFAGGYDWGSNLNLFSGFDSGAFDLSSYTSNVPSYSELGGIADDVSDIAGSASSIQKSVNMSEEDLKSLVDVAERRYVNNINLTAQTPVINIAGQNTGNTAADRKNLADTIRDILVEQVAAGSTISTARAY
jgi:tape measure domain-containing protein